jgi:serine/threonine protein kinase
LEIPEGGFSVEEALRKLKLFLDSYEGIYKRNIVHRNLQPSNILYDSDGTMKIKNLGISHKNYEKAEIFNALTNKMYASPQQLKF